MPPLPNPHAVPPYDDETILGDDLIIRRIDPLNHLVDDENRNCRRISSKAFKASTGGGMSVDLPKLIEAAGLIPADYVTTPKYIGSVQFPASVPREVGLWVGKEPIPDENPYHGEIWKGTEGKSFTSGQTNALGNAAQWLVQIPDVELFSSLLKNL